MEPERDRGGCPRKHGARDAVQLLAKILSGCGLPKYSSEVFRQAKFNRAGSTVADMWGLLFLALQAIERLGSQLEGDHQDPPPVAERPEASRYVQHVVRTKLLWRGYRRGGVYGDPVGSRELLVAFGWLLQDSDFFLRAKMHHLRAANRARVPWKKPAPVEAQLLAQSIEDETDLLKREVESTMSTLRFQQDPLALKKSLDKLNWFRGRLQGKWKSLVRTQDAYVKSFGALLGSLQGTSLAEQLHTPVHELFLLRYPDQLSPHVAQLERHVCALEDLLAWEQSEHRTLFWQWMESVVDLGETDEQTGDSPLDVEPIRVEVCSLLQEKSFLTDKLASLWTKRKGHLTEREVKEEILKLCETPQHLALHMAAGKRTPRDDCRRSLARIEDLTATDLCLVTGSGSKRVPHAYSQLEQAQLHVVRVREALLDQLCSLQQSLPSSVAVVNRPS